VLPETDRKRVHRIIRRAFVAGLTFALAAATASLAATPVEPIGLGGAQSQLSALSPVSTLPNLDAITAPPPAAAEPGSPAATAPASSTPSPRVSAPATQQPDRGSVGEPARRGASLRSPAPSSRPPSSVRNGVRAAADASPANPRGASRQTRQPTGSHRSHKPSIATQIVDRVPSEYRKAVLALAAVAVLFGFLSLHEARRSRRAREDALADSLTGLANREGLELRLEEEWRRASRYERDLGLVMLDLDGFKQINDSQGHMAGDRILRQAAAAIGDRVRATDLASRYGGDEFVVLCPETADRGLKTLAEGLEETLARHGIRASAGFTQREPSDSSSKDLLARADAAMYRRKRESSAHAGALAAAEA
jgi:diguanylate cyclase (GGDEF)-like protein